MRLAVGERHPEVDHRVAVADPALHLRAHALLDAGMNCRGTDPPTTLSTNSSPEPLGERLDAELADRVLAVAAGLLDVTPAALGGPVNVSRSGTITSGARR